MTYIFGIKLLIFLIFSEKKNDIDLVIEMCTEISNMLTKRIEPEFTKGKHLTFDQALERLPVVMGERAFYETSAMTTILRQEIDRYDRLLSVIFRSMDDLVKALRGEIVISKTCENVFESFLLQRVPDEWSSNAYPSVKPLAAWLKNLAKRIRFFSLWCMNLVLYVEGVHGIDRNPLSIWISGFIFPQGLLAAISQNYARKYQTSIDLLEFKYDIQSGMSQAEVNVDDLFTSIDGVSRRKDLDGDDDSYNKKGDGIFLCGFYIDGGRWDSVSSRLVDSPQRFSSLPHFVCQMIKVKNFWNLIFNILWERL